MVRLALRIPPCRLLFFTPHTRNVVAEDHLPSPPWGQLFLRSAAWSSCQSLLARFISETHSDSLSARLELQSSLWRGVNILARLCRAKRCIKEARWSRAHKHPPASHLCGLPSGSTGPPASSLPECFPFPLPSINCRKGTLIHLQTAEVGQKGEGRIFASL